MLGLPAQLLAVVAMTHGELPSSDLWLRRTLGTRRHGVPLLIEPHPEAEPHGAQDLLDFVQGLSAEVLRLQHLSLGLLDQLPDRRDVGILKAVVGAYGELQFLHGPV